MPKYATSRYKKKTGSREQVWAGVAQQTSGGLKKKDLMVSKTGKLVSKKASKAASNRMKKGTGLCGHCIKLYKQGKISSRNYKNKKPVKKSIKKSTKKSTKKSVKKTEYKLKVPKVKGASKKRVEELKKEIEKLRVKAGRIAEREGRMTKEVKKHLENVTKKTREMIMMKKALKAKNKKKK